MKLYYRKMKIEISGYNFIEENSSTRGYSDTGCNNETLQKLWKLLPDVWIYTSEEPVTNLFEE